MLHLVCTTLSVPMAKRSMRTFSSQKRHLCPAWVMAGFAGFAGLALLLLMFFVDHRSENDKFVKTAEMIAPHIIVEDKIGDTFVSRCGSTNSASTAWILLHGAKYSRADWKVIQPELCTLESAAYALDLPSQRTRVDLQKIMKRLSLGGKDVYLVTPSASGRIVSDWLENDIDGFADIFHTWVPVAPVSMLTLDLTYLRELKDRSVRVHAVYGRQDEKGRQISIRLAEEVSASLEEIEGGHPCYLDSPNDFIASMDKLMSDAK